MNHMHHPGGQSRPSTKTIDSMPGSQLNAKKNGSQKTKSELRSDCRRFIRHGSCHYRLVHFFHIYPQLPLAHSGMKAQCLNVWERAMLVLRRIIA